MTKTKRKKTRENAPEVPRAKDMAMKRLCFSPYISLKSWEYWKQSKSLGFSTSSKMELLPNSKKGNWPRRRRKTIWQNMWAGVAWKIHRKIPTLRNARSIVRTWKSMRPWLTMQSWYSSEISARRNSKPSKVRKRKEKRYRKRFKMRSRQRLATASSCLGKAGCRSKTT